MKWDLGVKEKDGTGSGMLRCVCCFTQFRVDFKFYKGVGVALFVNRWKMLGEGPGKSNILGLSPSLPLLVGLRRDLHC